MGFVLRPVSDNDVASLFELETASYPADEAASLESLKFRAAKASDYFKVACTGDEIVGFVCGTLCHGTTLTHDSMSKHVADGTTLCIHSVVVAPSLRRQGVATWMVKTYLRQVHENVPQVELCLLIAKQPVMPLYQGAGFTAVGLSSVVHGKDSWYELKHEFAQRPQLPIVQVDAFTNKPFGGNPAAVVILSANYVTETEAAAQVSDEWLQNVGMENNLSETAFLQPLADGRWRIRWFSPTSEIALCGHATVGAAHALASEGFIPRCQSKVDFISKSGPLATSIDGEWLTLDFPAEVVAPLPDAEGSASSAQLAAALGIDVSSITFIGRNRLDLVAEVRRDEFDLVKPDFALLRAFGRRAVCVTAQGRESESAAFVSRLFAPAVGIDEDPVTGSAHCGLTPYWASKLKKGDGEVMEAWQTSKRGGVLRVSTAGDRVLIKGQAVTILRGMLASAACPRVVGAGTGAGGAGAGSSA